MVQIIKIIENRSQHYYGIGCQTSWLLPLIELALGADVFFCGQHQPFSACLYPSANSYLGPPNDRLSDIR